MGMDSVDVKGDDRNVRVFVVKGKTFDSGELRERIIIQFSAMGFDVLKSDFFQKINRPTQSDRFSNRRRSRFETIGYLLDFNAIGINVLVHVTPVKNGLQFFQMSFFPVKDADSRRTQHFMPGKSKKITIQRLRQPEMLHSLRASTMTTLPFSWAKEDFFQGRPITHDIGNIGQGNDFNLVGQAFLKFSVDPAFFAQWNVTESRLFSSQIFIQEAKNCGVPVPKSAQRPRL